LDGFIQNGQDGRFDFFGDAEAVISALAFGHLLGKSEGGLKQECMNSKQKEPGYEIHVKWIWNR